MQRFDVIVIGGGMVGAATALALVQAGLEVAVVEKGTLPDPADIKLCETRASALTPASQRFLATLGVWPYLEAFVHPFTSMRVSSEDSAARVIFSAREVGTPALGWLVPNRAVQAALWSVLKGQVTLFEQASLTQLQQEKEGVKVRLEDGASLYASVLVGADGAHSRVRALAHIPIESHEYGQSAIVACVKTARHHEDACWQHYTVTGPVAFLAMREGVSSLAWYVPEARCAELLALEDEVFCEALTEASQGLLGHVDWVGPRAGFPLVRRHARHYVKGAVVLVGDAAHTVHPQAGQGVNLGFLDAATLAEVIQEANLAGAPWWHAPVLNRYVRRRYADNHLVQRAMDGFDALFRQDFPWKAPLRWGVMRAAATVKPVRALLTEVAMTGRFEV